MYFGKLGKIRKRYFDLIDKKKQYYAEMDRFEEINGCNSCETYNSRNVKELSERYAGCSNCKYVDEIIKIADSIDSIIAEIDRLIEGEFSEAIYCKYYGKNPQIVDSSNGEVADWNELFGESFDKVTKSKKHALVGLYLGNGTYKFK